jgi:hypothetical protein
MGGWEILGPSRFDDHVEISFAKRFATTDGVYQEAVFMRLRHEDVAHNSL